MKSGIELITEERNRQIFDLNYTAEHDQDHLSNELLQLAVNHIYKELPIFTIEFLDAAHKKEHIKNLTQAGALIAAEIDRLQTDKD